MLRADLAVIGRDVDELPGPLLALELGEQLGVLLRHPVRLPVRRLLHCRRETIERGWAVVSSEVRAMVSDDGATTERTESIEGDLGQRRGRSGRANWIQIDLLRDVHAERNSWR